MLVKAKKNFWKEVHQTDNSGTLAERDLKAKRELSYLIGHSSVYIASLFSHEQ